MSPARLEVFLQLRLDLINDNKKRFESRSSRNKRVKYWRPYLGTKREITEHVLKHDHDAVDRVLQSCAQGQNTQTEIEAT